LHHVRRPWARQTAVLLFCLALTAYFGRHAIDGRYGLRAQSKLLDRAAVLEFELDGLTAARAKLDRDIALLAPDPPDPGLVEEISRDVLGFAYPEDRILAAPIADAP
jgi:cell division protein FtsB